jgi:hypothetical protein
VTDKGTEHLLRFPGLLLLDLSDTRVTDAGLKNVKQLTPKLTCRDRCNSVMPR